MKEEQLDSKDNNMVELSFEELLLDTAFYTMACDGDIADEEVEAIRSMSAETDIFNDLEVEVLLNKKIRQLNKFGELVIRRFLRITNKRDFTESQKNSLLKVAIDIIFSDNEVEYNEIRFFRHLKSNIAASDKQVLAINENATELLGEEISYTDLADSSKSQFFSEGDRIEFDEISFSDK